MNFSARRKAHKSSTGKTTPIRRTAGRETSASRQPYVHLKPLGPSQHYSIEGLNRVASIGPPLCRETLASQTSNVSFSSLGTSHEGGFFWTKYDAFKIVLEILVQ